MLNCLHKRLFVLCIGLLGITHISSYAQSGSITNQYISDSGLAHLNIERSFIYKPETEWLYAHHPYICFFKEHYIAIWSNGMKDEDASGQRVAMSVSKDFTNWSKTQVLAVPNIDQESTLNVLTAAGFHQYGDTLVVYYGEYSPKRTHTKLWAKYTIDGK
ncbi:MAG: hypothetical protein RLY16_875, partial [Bacteroidota bacterium]